MLAVGERGVCAIGSVAEVFVGMPRANAMITSSIPDSNKIVLVKRNSIKYTTLACIIPKRCCVAKVKTSVANCTRIPIFLQVLDMRASSHYNEITIRLIQRKVVVYSFVFNVARMDCGNPNLIYTYH